MENTQRSADDRGQYRQMTQTPIPSLILKMAIPTSVSMVVTAIYNIGDTYFVSRLGTSASGAVGIVLPLMAIIQAVGVTIGLGAGSWISRLLGEQKKERADEIASAGFLSSLIFGGLISLFGLLYLNPLMALLGATGTILPYALDYARYILCFAPVMTASFVLNNILRSQGKARFAMFGIASGGVLNLLLDPLFIFSLGLGIRGAAIATGISQSVGLLILTYSFVAKKSIVSISPRKLSRNITDYLLILKFGMPSFCRQGLSSVATVLLNQSARPYGDAAIAAMSIVGKLFMILFAIQLGIGQGYQPVLGYNYGAKRYDRVKKAFIFTNNLGTGLMSFFGLLMFIFAPAILTAFISDDPHVVDIGSLALRAQCIAMPFTSLCVVCNMSYQTTGRSLWATLLSAARQGVFYIPLILLLPQRIGLTGVQITQAAADMLTFFVSIPFALAFFSSIKRMERADGAVCERESE